MDWLQCHLWYNKRRTYIMENDMNISAVDYWKYLSDNHPELVKNPEIPFTFEQWNQLGEIFIEFMEKKNDNNNS